MRASKKITATAVAGLLVAAAPASAQVLNPTVGSYSAPAATIQTTVTPQHTPAANITSNTPSTPSPTQSVASTANSKTLPFTGLQVGLVVLAGVALLGVGFGVRRVVRTPAS
jgi:hypothetical protein